MHPEGQKYPYYSTNTPENGGSNIRGPILVSILVVLFLVGAVFLYFQIKKALPGGIDSFIGISQPAENTNTIPDGQEEVSELETGVEDGQDNQESNKDQGDFIVDLGTIDELTRELADDLDSVGEISDSLSEIDDSNEFEEGLKEFEKFKFD